MMSLARNWSDSDANLTDRRGDFSFKLRKKQRMPNAVYLTWAITFSLSDWLICIAVFFLGGGGGAKEDAVRPPAKVLPWHTVLVNRRKASSWRKLFNRPATLSRKSASPFFSLNRNRKETDEDWRKKQIDWKTIFSLLYLAPHWNLSARKNRKNLQYWI